MRYSLDGAELSLIPDNDDERKVLKVFMEAVGSNDNRFVDASLDGTNLDELVIQPFCKGDG